MKWFRSCSKSKPQVSIAPAQSTIPPTQHTLPPKQRLHIIGSTQQPQQDPQQQSQQQPQQEHQSQQQSTRILHAQFGSDYPFF